MADPAAEAPPPAELPRGKAAEALALGAVFLLAVFLVLRTVAFQLTPYCIDAGLAGFVGVLAAAMAWAAWLVSGPAARKAWAPCEAVLLSLGLWVGLLAAGLWRTPNLGRGWARASEMLVAALLVVGVYLLVRARGSLARVAAALIVAMGSAEALYGVAQKFFILPRMRDFVAAGTELPEGLDTQMGIERLSSEEIFGTFGNANSYAGFLIVSILILIGLLLFSPKRAEEAPPRGLFARGREPVLYLALALQGYALWLSNGKGAWVAALIGCALFLAQWLSTTPVKRTLFGALSIAGVAALVIVLVLATAGVLGEAPFGASMYERLGYWRTGWDMWTAAPWIGHGLGSFGDVYAQFKRPLSTEAQNAHNDWAQFAIEIGLLGPLVWALLWYALARPWGVKVRPEAGAPSGDAEETKWSVVALGGGLLAFFMIFTASNAMNAVDVRLLPDALGGGDVLPGTAGIALAVLAVPLGFALTYLAAATRCESESSVEGSRELVFALRASIGAVLIHQLVDFDHAAPGVMAALFIAGGALWALRDRARAATVAPLGPGLLAKMYAWTFPLAGLAALVAAGVVPLMSGLAREEAQAIARDLSEAATREDRLALHEQEVRAREEALWWAPFDGQAAVEWALACARMKAAGRATWTPPGYRAPVDLGEVVEAGLLQAHALRPRWAGGSVLLGHKAMVDGFAALARRRPEEAGPAWEKAATHYTEAARLFPNAPLMRILLGDARLMKGDVDGAMEAYRQAWVVDKIIRDGNQRLLSVLHDPNPGCLRTHGQDAQIVRALDRLVRDGPLDEAMLKGLFVRRAWGLASEWLAVARPHRRLEALVGGPEATQGERDARDRANRSFLDTCANLARAWGDDGHAALFYAGALNVVLRGQKKTPEDEARVQRAWAAAYEAQRRSVEAGVPDTPPMVFDEIRARVGTPQE